MHGHDGNAHAAGHESYADRPHPEFVVLEIGGELGALIVHVDGDLHGREVEISPAGEDARRSHKDVLERTIGGRPAYTAVFDQMPEGTYTLWTDGTARDRDVAIRAGCVAELDWTAGALAS